MNALASVCAFLVRACLCVCVFVCVCVCVRERERERGGEGEDNTLIHKDKDLSTGRLFYKSVPYDKHSNTQYVKQEYK